MFQRHGGNQHVGQRESLSLVCPDRFQAAGELKSCACGFIRIGKRGAWEDPS
jgi:hypothetical protein